MISFTVQRTPYEAKIAIGRALRAHRLVANLSQRELARRSGVSEATIKRIEASGTASLEHVLMVAFALGLDAFADLPEPAPRSIEDVVEPDCMRRRASRVMQNG